MKKSLVAVFATALLVSTPNVSNAFEIYMGKIGKATVYLNNGKALSIPAYSGQWLMLDGAMTRKVVVTDTTAANIDRVCFANSFSRNETCTNIRASDTWAKFK